MSGILDNKSRIMDTIITLEGRRQIANAQLKIEYVSFSDNSTFYKKDIASGSADATSRIYFEQCHLPQDQIAFEADDSGRLSPFKNDSDISIKDGQILTYSFDALTASVLTGSNQMMQILSGEEFASTAQTLLKSSVNNYEKLRVISTKDKLFEDDGFLLGNSNIEFVINENRPIQDISQHSAHINHLESLYQDVRLSKLPNFKYLPPINKTEIPNEQKRDHRKTSKHQLGNYKPWGRSHLYGLSPKQLEYELQHYEKIGYSKTLSFEPTTSNNKLMGQFFELDSNVMKKLDVIDYGQYSWKGKLRHAFFIGKVMVDENETNTFIHMFTMVFG